MKSYYTAEYTIKTYYTYIMKYLGTYFCIGVLNGQWVSGICVLRSG